jgi:hypothetical protein
MHRNIRRRNAGRDRPRLMVHPLASGNQAKEKAGAIIDFSSRNRRTPYWEASRCHFARRRTAMIRKRHTNFIGLRNDNDPGNVVRKT